MLSHFKLHHCLWSSWITYCSTGWIYVLEMALKVYSFGFENYWSDGQNRFDFLITWIIGNYIGQSLPHYLWYIYLKCIWITEHGFFVVLPMIYVDDCSSTIPIILCHILSFKIFYVENSNLSNFLTSLYHWIIVIYYFKRRGVWKRS